MVTGGDGGAIATRETPPIPGLYVFAEGLPYGVAEAALGGIAEDDLFSGGKRDQVMLFDRHIEDKDYDPILDDRESSLPPYILALLTEVDKMISPQLPQSVATAIFDQSLSRQVIINLYPPGEGISPHIDLPHRYADGILGVSLCGGCAMTLRHARTGEEHHVYLPSGSVYCLTGEARWEWSHGIEGGMVDVVQDMQGRRTTLMRELRVSVTFRWMTEGADELVELAS